MADENVESKPPVGVKRSGKPTFLIVAVLMGLEGVGIFFVTKLVVAPQPSAAVAAEGHAATQEGETPAGRAQTTAEVELTDCRPSNRMSGRTFTFRLRVSGLVSAEDRERATALVEANRARITDRVNFVIRSAEPQQLNEPGLETVKRRMKHEIDLILGDEQLVKEILIPEMLQSGTGL